MSAEPPTPPDPIAYGQPISAERQAALQAILDAWNAPGADHGDRKGPFEGLELTGADVSWLAEQSGRGASGEVPNLHLEGAYLKGARLEGADLREAHLEGAYLTEARLEHADLRRAYLVSVYLIAAHLEGAKLGAAHLEGANLVASHLEGANLSGSHLEGAFLIGAHLEGAHLNVTWLDNKTLLTDAVLDDKTRLADIQWSGVGVVNLTRVKWGDVPRLGDETSLKRKAEAWEIEAVVRAYRQLAAQLRAQGMAEVADRFSERAQIVQRRVLRKRRRYGQWFFSWLLALLAGYGYRPGRTISWYLMTVAAFAVAYYTLGPSQGHTFLPDGALVFSVTSFHGRGFFPEALSFESWVSRLAALEAVLGLFIEISFIATFTQRFFGAK